MEKDSYHIHFKIFVKASSMLLLLAFALLVFACTPNNPEEIKAFTEKEDLPNVSFKEFEGIATDSGRLKYRLISPEILQFDSREEPTTDFPKGLHFYVYNDDEEIESQIKCNFAIYFQKTELWELRNDVEIINISGNAINTELLYWDTIAKRIYSEEFVKITTNDDVLTGYGFETDESISVYSIKKASGNFLVEDN